MQALRFQCSPYYVNSAFWPVIDNFERALKFTRDETTEAKLDKLETLVVTQYGRPMTDVRFVAAILSIPCEERYGALSMTPQKHKDETLRTLVDLIGAGAHKQPTVMLFEDVHWADPTTLEALDLLIDCVKTVPLLIVLTHRPEFQSRWSEQGHVGALNLSKLTRTQSAAMVFGLTGGKALPVALLEQILTRTDGVPLFVEELTKSVLELGALTEAGDHYEYGGSARTVSIPASLRDSLMARLDRFMPVKEIAQIGAAIGREFSYEVIAEVAPMPRRTRRPLATDPRPLYACALPPTSDHRPAIPPPLTTGAHEFDHRHDHKDLRERAEECERLGRENSLPVLWALFARVSYGLALIREGKVAEGIASLKAGVAFREASGGKSRNPVIRTFLAEAMALTGDLDNALQLIDEQIVQIERPGWEERLAYPEILRLKGWMFSLKGDLGGAEQNFLASLDWARRQQAKMWELRTSTSLARLWQSQGKRQDAYELLAPVYGWFTEGFDTKDLQDAKALLDELA